MRRGQKSVPTLKTYYLTENMSKTGEKLGTLKGWELEVAKALLAPSAEERDKVALIRKVLEGRGPATNDSENDSPEALAQLIELLPKATRSRARVLLHHLPKSLRVKDGLVLFPDDTPGSPLIDVLKYYCSPRHFRVPLPQGFQRMNQLLKDAKVPQTAFSTDKSPYIIRASPTPSSGWVSL